MRMTMSPGLSAVAALLSAAAPAAAQIPLSTVSVSDPSGGEAEGIVVNPGGNRVFLYHPVSRSFSIFDVTSSAENFRGTRFIQDSPTFPDLLSPKIVARGNHVYIANTSVMATKLWCFDLAPANDATSTVSPLVVLTLPAATNIVDMEVSPLGQILAADSVGCQIFVVDDTLATPAFAAGTPITGGGMTAGPADIEIYDKSGLPFPRAYVGNNDGSVTPINLSTLQRGPDLTLGAAVSVLKSAPNTNHVCALQNAGNMIQFIDAAAGTYGAYPGVSLSIASTNANFSAPATMVIDDRSATESRLLILRQDPASGTAILLHVDASHDPLNPGGANPAILGYTPLNVSFIQNSFNRKFLHVDPVNNRAFFLNDSKMTVINTAQPSGAGKTSGSVTTVIAPVALQDLPLDDDPVGAVANGRFFGGCEQGGLRITDTAAGAFIGNFASNGFLNGIAADPVNDRILVSQSGSIGAFAVNGMTLAQTPVSIATPFLEGPIMDPTTGAAAYGRFLERTAASPDQGFFFVRPDNSVVSAALSSAEAIANEEIALDSVNHVLYTGFLPNTIRRYDFNPSSATFGQVLNSYTVSMVNGTGEIKSLAFNTSNGVLYVAESPTGSGNSQIHGLVGATGAVQFSPIDTAASFTVDDIIVHPGLNRFYFSHAGTGTIRVHDGSTGALIGSASAPICITFIIKVFAPMLSTNRLYMFDQSSNLVVMNMDGASFTCTSLGNFSGVETDGDDVSPPLVASDRNQRVYFVNLMTNELKILDADPASGSFNTIVGTLATGLGPHGVAVNEKTGRVFVIHEAGNIGVFGPGVATVNLGPVNLMPKTVRKDDTNLPVFPFQYVLNSTENAQIIFGKFTGSGSGNEASDVSSVRFMEDTNGDGFGDSDVGGGSQTFSADNGYAQFSGSGPALTAGGTRNFVLTYNLSGSGSSGTTFQVTHGSQDVKVIGSSSGIPLTLTGTADPMVGGVLTLTDPRTTFSRTFSGGTTASAYQMAGVPLNTSSTVATQAIQQITGGSYDKTKARFLVWDSFSQQYIEFGSTSALKPSPAGSQPSFTAGFFEPEAPCGFWIICRNTCPITWTGTSNGAPAASLSDTLDPGWNLVTNPFDQPVPMSGMSVLGSGSSTLTNTGNSMTTQGAYFWSGGSYQFETGAVQPGQGYWIQNLTTGTVSLYFDRPPFSTKGAAASAVSRASAPPPGAAPPPPPPSQAPTTTSSSGGGGGGGGGCFLAGSGSSALPMIPFALAGLVMALTSLRSRRR